MNTAPSREDSDRLDARSHEYARLADEATDEVKRDRLLQAAQARITSGRMLEGRG
jgi:hypothetical protein